MGIIFGGASCLTPCSFTTTPRDSNFSIGITPLDALDHAGGHRGEEEFGWVLLGPCAMMAAEGDADLIVVGKHGQNWVESMAIGSTPPISARSRAVPC